MRLLNVRVLYHVKKISINESEWFSSVSQTFAFKFSCAERFEADSNFFYDVTDLKVTITQTLNTTKLLQEFQLKYLITAN